MRLKTIREGADKLPNSDFIEPNLIQIKNALKRADQLMSNFAKNQDFESCGEIKNLKTGLEKMVNAYLNNPGANEQLLDQIDSDVAKIKSKQF